MGSKTMLGGNASGACSASAGVGLLHGKAGSSHEGQQNWLGLNLYSRSRGLKIESFEGPMILRVVFFFF